MKKITLLFLLILTSSLVLGQKKEKIKGSKIVTLSIKKLENFQNIDIEDNLEVYLVKADSASLEIEADDNLHDIINYTVLGNTLRIKANVKIQSDANTLVTGGDDVNIDQFVGGHSFFDSITTFCS